MQVIDLSCERYMERSLSRRVKNNEELERKRRLVAERQMISDSMLTLSQQFVFDQYPPEKSRNPNQPGRSMSQPSLLDTLMYEGSIMV